MCLHNFCSTYSIFQNVAALFVHNVLLDLLEGYRTHQSNSIRAVFLIITIITPPSFFSPCLCCQSQPTYKQLSFSEDNVDCMQSAPHPKTAENQSGIRLWYGTHALNTAAKHIAAATMSTNCKT